MDASASPTFAERCTKLRSHISRIQSIDADKGLVRTMENIRTELVGHLSRVEALMKTRQVFSAIDGMLLPVIDVNALKGLKKTIGTLIGKLDNNRSQIGSGNTWADCDVKAKGLADNLERDLRVIWTKFISDERPAYEMFNAFSALPQCTTPLRELQRLSGVLDGLRKTLPLSPAAIEEVRSTAARMREHINSLGLDGEPAEMVAFLKKCSGPDGAPLTDLTPEVFQWIKDKGYAATLRVKPR
ncbi:MAG: hypothetical protein KDN05_00285 [Verrucomicrobiae bacterium]|nr:hypothetical protein [Verrucomicrobiae bacterium]